MTKTPREHPPSVVPERAKQGGEIDEAAKPRLPVEPSVWTDSMLRALHRGVKGGKWFSLIDKVWRPENLRAAFAKVKRNAGAPGVDHITIEAYERHLEDNLHRLSEALRTGTYRPQAIRRVVIPKPGSPEGRPLGIPTVQDRVAQAALRNVIEPIFEKDFAEHSYGFRPHRGCKNALRRVRELLAAGHLWVVDADLKSYFDTIPHDRLMERVGQKISDGRVLDLIASYLRQRVMTTGAAWTPEEGTPQGAVISPLLANLYLDPLDHLMAGRGLEMVRYADDFVILCKDEAAAQAALRMVQEWTVAEGLTLHPTKTQLVEVSETQGFDFLGYHFRLSGRRKGRPVQWPREKSQKKLRDSVRALTRRTSGHSMERIIQRLNPVLCGFFEYFKHSGSWVFERIDGWVRGRLRSILRHRKGLRGRGRGRDHQRWSNAFFDALGFFSMEGAHERLLQSSRR